jgi:hypothetical protein
MTKRLTQNQKVGPSTAASIGTNPSRLIALIDAFTRSAGDQRRETAILLPTTEQLLDHPDDE